MIGGRMDDHTLDPERRKRQQEAFQKIVEAGQVPPVLPKYPWVITDYDRKKCAGMGIDLDK
jgi:hypothetical protein